MAIQTGSLSSAEHDWWATRSALPASAPLNDHKKAYMGSEWGIPMDIPLLQAEKEWLEQIITSLGVSPPANLPVGELWKRLAGILMTGYSVGNKTVEEVKFDFYARNTDVI